MPGRAEAAAPLMCKGNSRKGIIDHIRAEIILLHLLHSEADIAKNRSLFGITDHAGHFLIDRKRTLLRPLGSVADSSGILTASRCILTGK